jgi:hypothetical protein
LLHLRPNGSLRCTVHRTVPRLRASIRDGRQTPHERMLPAREETTPAIAGTAPRPDPMAGPGSASSPTFSAQGAPCHRGTSPPGRDGHRPTAVPNRQRPGSVDELTSRTARNDRPPRGSDYDEKDQPHGCRSHVGLSAACGTRVPHAQPPSHAYILTHGVAGPQGSPRVAPHSQPPFTTSNTVMIPPESLSGGTSQQHQLQTQPVATRQGRRPTLMPESHDTPSRS